MDRFEPPVLARVNWTPFTLEVPPASFSRDVASVQELDELLDSLASEFPKGEPVLVSVVRANQDSLAIGIGAPVVYVDGSDDGDNEDDDEAPTTAPSITVLVFIPADGGPPTYTSLGHEPFTGDVVFFYLGQESEFDGRHAVPIEEGREAVRLFVAGQGWPLNLMWEED